MVLKSHTEIEGVPVWGEPLDNAVRQIVNCARSAERTALMADHHLGYSMPIGGVAAYRDAVSPSGVGYDISCGNKAVLLDADPDLVTSEIAAVMDEIWQTLSFGIGRKNDEPVEHELFGDDPAWDIDVAGRLKSLAQGQLGTIGSGNHYVDLFLDEERRVWCGVHFGSRGLGHKLATHFIRAGGGKEGIDVDPVLLGTGSQLGQEYVACMKLAGRYAYAGRDWVCAKVAALLRCNILDEVHNHHNFAWEEKHFGEELWVVRKGATPAFPGQRGFGRRLDGGHLRYRRGGRRGGERQVDVLHRPRGRAGDVEDRRRRQAALETGRAAAPGRNRDRPRGAPSAGG